MRKCAAAVLAVLSVVCVSISLQAAGKGVATQFGAPSLSRDDFNRLAVESGLPLFWIADRNSSGTVEVAELVPVGAGKSLSPYVEGGKFTDKFRDDYLGLVELRRREAVKRELDSGYAAIMRSDFSKSPASDRKVVEHMVAAGRIVDELYSRQKGAFPYIAKLPKDDALSRALFERNQGPWCAAPKTQDDPFCSALASFPPKLSDAYPEGMAQDEAMCESLKKFADGKKLLSPFTVVRRVGGKLVALPLTEVYGARMKDVARELRAAAEPLGDDEKAFRAYLLAAAKGFETNDWSEADEAWVAMNSHNSKWYLRVAPDETYFDPCQEKAGFQVSFGRIDLSAVKWADRVSKVRQEMEDSLAKLIGDAYKPRQVNFSIPDFIQIVLNSGDGRTNQGATVGETLPNWGKVAEENRRRIMVVTNFYTDPDSVRMNREKLSTMLDADSMRAYSDDREPSVLKILLHEVTHNLGPHSDYKFNGKGASEVYGGRTATTLEEVKAEAGGLWYIDFLKRKGYLTQKQVDEAYIDSVAWCIDFTSRGMFTSTGTPKTYGQVAAIILGSLVKDGAVEWRKDEKNGDRFHVNLAKMPGAIEALVQKIGKLYANADAAGAKAFIDGFTAGEGTKPLHASEIETRYAKFPKQSFYYSVEY